uniref:Uncharacterized protein n=1 Tax=Pundamilia nyererei TaxID=303518 RepID=A0A3B4FIB2_9CICH
PGSADFSHNTSSSNSPVSCRGTDTHLVKSAQSRSLDLLEGRVSLLQHTWSRLVGRHQSQLTLSRSSTLPYDHAPQRAQPQRGGGVRSKTRPASPGSEMVTLEEFLQESNLQSPPRCHDCVSTGSREDLVTDYFARSPAPSAVACSDQATPTNYVAPTVQSSNQRPGQSVKPSPRQPVGQSPASAQRSSQSLSRTFSLASADLLRSNGPDSFRGHDVSPGQADAVMRRQGGGTTGRERPLSARFTALSNQHADGSFLNPPIHHSASLNLQAERYAERERDRGWSATSRNGPHRGEIAMVTPVRVPREGHGRCGSVERPKSTPASPDPNNDPQTVWYEYGCV